MFSPTFSRRAEQLRHRCDQHKSRVFNRDCALMPVVERNGWRDRRPGQAEVRRQGGRVGGGEWTGAKGYAGLWLIFPRKPHDFCVSGRVMNSRGVEARQKSPLLQREIAAFNYRPGLVSLGETPCSSSQSVPDSRKHRPRPFRNEPATYRRDSSGIRRRSHRTMRPPTRPRSCRIRNG